MQLVSRRLPREDWGRLVGTELEHAAQHLPAESQVLVVEDEGRIVACWALIPYWHVECLWISELHRKRGRVGLYLWRAMKAAAQAVGVKAVLTAATTHEVRELLKAVDAQKLPGDHYVMPMGGD